MISYMLIIIVENVLSTKELILRHFSSENPTDGMSRKSCFSLTSRPSGPFIVSVWPHMFCSLRNKRTGGRFDRDAHWPHYHTRNNTLGTCQKQQWSDTQAECLLARFHLHIQRLCVYVTDAIDSAPQARGGLFPFQTTLSPRKLWLGPTGRW